MVICSFASPISSLHLPHAFSIHSSFSHSSIRRLGKLAQQRYIETSYNMPHTGEYLYLCLSLVSVLLILQNTCASHNFPSSFTKHMHIPFSTIQRNSNNMYIRIGSISSFRYLSYPNSNFFQFILLRKQYLCFIDVQFGHF